MAVQNIYSCHPPSGPSKSSFAPHSISIAHRTRSFPRVPLNSCRRLMSRCSWMSRSFDKMLSAPPSPTCPCFSLLRNANLGFGVKATSSDLAPVMDRQTDRQMYSYSMIIIYHTTCTIMVRAECMTLWSWI